MEAAVIHQRFQCHRDLGFLETVNGLQNPTHFAQDNVAQENRLLAQLGCFEKLADFCRLPGIIVGQVTND